MRCNILLRVYVVVKLCKLAVRCEAVVESEVEVGFEMKV